MELESYGRKVLVRLHVKCGLAHVRAKVYFAKVQTNTKVSLPVAVSEYHCQHYTTRSQKWCSVAVVQLDCLFINPHQERETQFHKRSTIFKA